MPTCHYLPGLFLSSALMPSFQTKFMEEGGRSMSRDSTSDVREIGSKIKFFRKQRHWTQEVLAQEVGTSASAICDIEKGNRNLGTELLCRIAMALGHELSDFEPESVYNNFVCESEIDEVLSNIKHTYMGLDPEKKAIMVKQLEALGGTFVLF